MAAVETERLDALDRTRLIGTIPFTGSTSRRGTDASDDETDVMTLRVQQLVYEADGVISVRLVQPSGGTVPDWTPGAHLALMLPSGRTRHYSLCGDPADRTAYRLAVLREPGGRGGSVEIHDTLRVGTIVRAKSPRNNFELVDAEDYILIAGGIGITPILSMARHLTGRRRPWRLYYGGRSRQSMAFVPELQALSVDGVEITAQDEQGMLDLDEILARATAHTVIYCCGPEQLLTALSDRCHGLGLADRLHMERFSASRVDPGIVEESAPSGFDVVLARSGSTVTVRPDTTVLQALRTLIPNIPSACEQGICGACEVRVLDGTPEHHDQILTGAEREANDRMLVCVSRSRSPLLLLDI